MYKKIIVNIFLIISILILSGCGAAQSPNGELSGIPFSYYKEYSYNDKTYTIYAIENDTIDYLNGTVYYKYTKYNKQNVKTWIINYIDNNQYYIYSSSTPLHKEQINEFSKNIKDSLTNYQNKLNMTFDIYEDETKIEKEFIIENNTYENIYIIDMYIPFNLLINETREVYTILVPVKTIIGYQQSNLISINYDNNNVIESLNIDNFLNTYFVENKVNYLNKNNEE